MTVSVVVGLEAVDIKHDHRQRVAVALGAAALVGQHGLHMPTVEEAGQGIGGGLAVNVLVSADIGKSGGGLACKRLKARQIAAGKCAGRIALKLGNTHDLVSGDQRQQQHGKR